MTAGSGAGRRGDGSGAGHGAAAWRSSAIRCYSCRRSGSAFTETIMCDGLAKPKKGDGRRARKKRARLRDAAERKQKQVCRDRDGGCRFPLCGCRQYGVAEVAHLKHKGMGGNPAGDRSVPELMICLCGWRHREGQISMHRETLTWEPLTDQGANGPVRWLVRGRTLFVPFVETGMLPSEWWELARETAPGTLAPLNDGQRTALNYLARMDS